MREEKLKQVLQELRVLFKELKEELEKGEGREKSVSQ